MSNKILFFYFHKFQEELKDEYKLESDDML